MHWIRLAPLLSATVRKDFLLNHLLASSAASQLLWAVTETSAIAQRLWRLSRTGLRDPDTVTNATGVVFVVGFVAGGAADRLLIDGVGEAGSPPPPPPFCPSCR